MLSSSLSLATIPTKARFKADLSRIFWERNRPRLRPIGELTACWIFKISEFSSLHPNYARADQVWLIDKKDGAETFSNGLRIEDDGQAGGAPVRKAFRVFRQMHFSSQDVEWRDQPAGIVYHTTESDLVPFSPGQSEALQYVGQTLLRHVRSNCSYHFLIDRFGRVFRVVPEANVAFHAGHSVWGDADTVYVNLNSAFLGVAVETQTRAGEAAPVIGAAQIEAARVLTEMLRFKYHIEARNCVTHAQVSINPDRLLIGYHTDWAANFPFAELGLPDNYALPPASISKFGFGYDQAFVSATGPRFWPGLRRAVENVSAQAARNGLSVSEYKKQLQRNYKNAAVGA